MTYPRVPRPGQLDTRQDSPMSEDVYTIHESPVNGNVAHGLPTPSHDVPSSGFTAVNGDISRSTSFRPDDSARVAMTPSNGDHRRPGASQQKASSSVLHNHHGWHLDERNGTDQERDRHQQGTTAPVKRKRGSSNSASVDEDVRDGHAYGLANQSPKRRMRTLNSGPFPSLHHSNHSRSDSDDSDLEPATAANNKRAPSPIYRAGHGTPPPPPPRESEDALAKSLQATLGPRNDDEGRPSTHSASPNGELHDGQQSQPYGSDHTQQSENADPKKRKRNFSNRTKTGCHTCRSRKKKCDEGKPTCENCKRGGFDCGGYGPKPPGVSKISAIRSALPLQAKHPYEYAHGPSQYFEQHPAPPLPPPPPPPPHLPPHHASSPAHHIGSTWDAPRPEAFTNPQHRYGPPPPLPLDQRSLEPWGARAAWPTTEPAISYGRDRLPPVDFNGPSASQGYSHDPQAPGDPWRPPPGHSHYRPPPPPPAVMSNHSSNSARSRHNLPAIPLPGPPSERMKMLTGQPYKHFLDDQLMHERASCKRAVESYNEACTASSTADGPEKERRFLKILDPSARNFSEFMNNNWNGPIGECGARTYVEAPFACEYGYNIKLGNDILISANCLMEDACLVTIGDRTIVGKNVKFHCITASVDASLRAGSQGNFTAGAITVEDDCVIGAGSIILPYRTIGKGAVVGAGSVVTRDVKPYTVVAGNPAKPIRKRKIESGPNVDRHDEDIQEENEKMLEFMRRRPFNRERIP